MIDGAKGLTALRSKLIDDGGHPFVDLVTVDRTLNELIEAQTKLAPKIMSGKRGDTSVSVDPATNGVRVYLASDLSADRVAEIKQQADALPVPVSYVAQPRSSLVISPDACSFPHCDRPLRGGVAIAPWGSNWTCSSGFMAVLPSDYSVKYLLTAGHCLDGHPANQDWKAYAPTFSAHWPIGPQSTFVHGAAGDAGKIRVRNYGSVSKWYTTTMVGRVAAWQTDVERPVRQIVRYPVNGQIYCRYGMINPATQRVCGYVTDQGPRCFDYTTGPDLCQMWAGNACGVVGDSGGSITGSGDVAMGIHSGSGVLPGSAPCSGTPFAPPGWQSTSTVVETIQNATNAWIIWEPLT